MKVTGISMHIMITSMLLNIATISHLQMTYILNAEYEKENMKVTFESGTVNFPS
jgi:hypothetical protein